MTANVKCLHGWDFPFLDDFNWLWHTVWASDSQERLAFLWHFERSGLPWYFSAHSNRTRTPCLTWHMIMTFMCTVPMRDIDLCHVMINAEVLLARLIFLLIQWFLNWKIAVTVSCSVFALLQGTCPCQQLNSWRINTGLATEKHLSTNSVGVHF